MKAFATSAGGAGHSVIAGAGRTVGCARVRIGWNSGRGHIGDACQSQDAFPTLTTGPSTFWHGGPTGPTTPTHASHTAE
ncbi:hypothetical protein QMK19_20810 [Streptomyces sp. H10-C2]|uniref:hypothetical protein n=1 Tax=unclassified Streptomyces TaxID=2593676 RepID=UPI0024B99708|nr:MULTISPECIES: hypothetical protein [unclassified Streptomyces]MDJ0344472.1 hypothetical protein [Streptomyces sp. PH10-H1]MDJ0372052.1 hypothetical protein [Streptomyces sp. H10-C2]